MKTTIKASPKNSWLFALIVSAAVACYVFLVFLPGQRATAELRQQFTQQQQYVMQSTKLGPQIAELEKELRRTHAFIRAWHADSPSEERLAHVFVAITEHANRAGADIVRFEPQAAEQLEYLRKVPLELAVEGSFTQLFTLVGALESLQAEFWIESLDMQPVPATPGRLRCELRLALFAGGTEISD